MPLLERGKPLMSELLWVLQECPHLEAHIKVLPDYCYNIFEVFKKTYFKGFPLLSETVIVSDQAGLKLAKTVAEAKGVVTVNWRNLGRMFGIVARCIRFAELESEAELISEGYGDLTPDKTKELLTFIFGMKWVEANHSLIANGSLEKLFSDKLTEFVASSVGGLQDIATNLECIAYHWSPSAMVELNDGFTEGFNSFLNLDGQLAGESPRAGIYSFLLLAWPEIKGMLESNPKKTVAALHEWMKPVMRIGVCTYVSIENLRDICEPPPRGIGLSLRPLKVRSSK